MSLPKIIDIETLQGGAPVTITAAKQDFAALAKRIGVLEVLSFSATFKAESDGPGITRLNGKLEARLMQECARTLEPLKTNVEDAFSLLLMNSDMADTFLENQEEDGLEDIEILEGDMADLGEIAIQYLSLAIDRFPVKKGAVLEPGNESIKVLSEDQDREEKKPVAALKDLNKKG